MNPFWGVARRGEYRCVRLCSFPAAQLWRHEVMMALRNELEFELIQSQMALKPILRGEVGARALRVRSVSRGEVWASAGVQGAWVSGRGCEAD